MTDGVVGEVVEHLEVDLDEGLLWLLAGWRLSTVGCLDGDRVEVGVLLVLLRPRRTWVGLPVCPLPYGPHQWSSLLPQVHDMGQLALDA